MKKCSLMNTIKKTCGLLVLLNATFIESFTIASDIPIVPEESSLSLSLIDVETQISPTSVLFLNKKALIIVHGLVWYPDIEQNTTTSHGVEGNEAEELKYSTWVNDKQVANGRVKLVETWNKDSNSTIYLFPQSIDVGVIEVNDVGLNSIRVILSNGNKESSTTLNVRSCQQWLSSIPILVSFFLFVIFKLHLIYSLFLAMVIGSSIIEGSIITGFRAVFSDYILRAASDSVHVSIIFFIIGISILMVMVKRSGGTSAVTKAVKRHSSKTRVAQLAIFIGGIVMFFDPYVSIMVVGKVVDSIMSSIPLSSEKISFLIDTTALPVASILPKSSWIMFAADLIQKEIDDKNIAEFNDIDGYALILSTIKYQFYPILILGLIALQLFTGRESGPILAAENQSRLNYKSKEQRVLQELTSEKVERSWNWYIPVCILNALLWVAFFHVDINFTEEDRESGLVAITWMTTVMTSIVITQLFFLVQKRNGSLRFFGDYCNRSDENRIAFLTDTFPSASGSISENFETSSKSKSEDSEDSYLKENEKDHLKTLNIHSEEENEEEEGSSPLNFFKEDSLLTLHETIQCLVDGTANAIPAILSLLSSWAVGYVYITLGIDRVVVSWILSDNISAQELPIVVFLAALMLSLIIGSSWCTISILIPATMGALIGKMGDSEDIIIVLASILSGAVAGDHVGPFSESTILSAIVSGSTVNRHFLTQAPYVILVIVLSLLIGTIPISFGAYPIFVGFILGFFILILFVVAVCEQVKRYLVSSDQSQEEPIARIIHPMLCSEMECDKNACSHHESIEENSTKKNSEAMAQDSSHNERNVVDFEEGTEIIKVGNKTSFVHTHTLQSFKTKLQEINNEKGNPILGLVEDGILPKNFTREFQKPLQGYNTNNLNDSGGNHASLKEIPSTTYVDKKRMIEATMTKAETDGKVFSDSLRVFLRTASEYAGKIIEGDTKTGNVTNNKSLKVPGSASADSDGDDSLDNLMSDILTKGRRGRFNNLGDSANTVSSGVEDYTTDGNGSFLETDISETATLFSSTDNGESSIFSSNGDDTSMGSVLTGPSAYSFTKSRQAMHATWIDNEFTSNVDEECTTTGDYTKASF